MGLRLETRARARALQLLYAWELQGQPAMASVVSGFPERGARSVPQQELAETLATAVVGDLERLDGEIAETADRWRLERIGVVERNILRLALHELQIDSAPARVVIDEAMRLARWFAGPKAPPFINGVLDTLARRHGRL